ncbi:MAG: ribosome biogenesis GTPase Der [Planctomycetes bacterium]|nr:ribosome biogenesis GTPase Der [Planctomycetota bacterium]
MSLPVVAIIGRPNVGKSSLFNRLVGRKIAIVDPTPGVTRDRVSSPCLVSDDPEEPRFVELVDTGGMGIVDSDNLTEHVEEQITCAIEQASCVIFLVDAREGLTALDRHVAVRLRRIGKPVILAANKVDEVNLISDLAEMNALGFGEPLPVSAAHGLGCPELFERLAGELGDQLGDRPAEPVMKLTIVGKRNAGKSTFINAIVGQKRLIVSEVPGTTRDSVDVRVELEGRTFLLIDTAGVRKTRKQASDVEFYSMHRALRSIRRADVVLLMIDASVPVSQVDKDLAGQIALEFKPVVLVVNKWDLADGRAMGGDYEEYFDKVFPEMSFAPISLTTATEALNIRQTVDLAEQLFTQANTRVPTARLNEAIEQIVAQRAPSHKTGTKPPKILYASQISAAPPTIVCFVNDPGSFDKSYQRFLINRMHELLPFSEVPIRLYLRQRRGRKEPVWREKDR